MYVDQFGVSTRLVTKGRAQAIMADAKTWRIDSRDGTSNLFETFNCSKKRKTPKAIRRGSGLLSVPHHIIRFFQRSEPSTCLAFGTRNMVQKEQGCPHAPRMRTELRETPDTRYTRYQYSFLLLLIVKIQQQQKSVEVPNLHPRYVVVDKLRVLQISV